MEQLAGGIVVKSINFGAHPFRKLKNFTIDISPRITLIAGHNGIGKSTILGLIANTFGLTERGAPKSYFGDFYFANMERIVYLALDEVEKAEKKTDSAVVVAESNGLTIKKRCALTRRDKEKRARVVPRTVDKADEDPYGPDAKLPLPTIYLGVKRLASIGEADDSSIESSALQMHDDDANLMISFINSITLGHQVDGNVTSQKIKGLGKSTAQPGYVHHDALAISVGQDSLASIATALASFNKLKREYDNYPGGLLIIDELDVGFHPHAIDRLARALKTYARKLNLQIIATTHSPRLIEAIHPQGDGAENGPDSVVYLLDTKRPRLAEDQSLKEIILDMAQRDGQPEPVVSKPVICIYFEDQEGVDFCEALFPRGRRGAWGKKYGVQIRLIALGVGGSNLLGLPEKDPIFKERILIVDADTSIPLKSRRLGNSLKLPCVKGASGTARSPENTVKKFLRDMVDGKFGDKLLDFNVTNPSTDKIERVFFSEGAGRGSDRNSSKTWWQDRTEQLVSWNVVGVWASCYPAESALFLEELEAAVCKLAGHMTAGLASLSKSS